ncbi:hypothetical protein Tco_1038220, partial [Tanacetum coccineum]
KVIKVKKSKNKEKPTRNEETSDQEKDLKPNSKDGSARHKEKVKLSQRRGSNNASTSGTLPSNTIPNPRNECNGITTRSGVVLDGPLPPMPLPLYVNPDNKDAKETKVTKDKVQPESSQSTANVQPRVDHGKGNVGNTKSVGHFQVVTGLSS